MGISGIDASLLGSLDVLSLKDLLRGKSGKSLLEELSPGELSPEGLAPDAAVAVQNASIANSIQNKVGVNAEQPNLMAGNFAGATGEQSRYIQATLQSFEVERQVVLASKEVLTAVAASMVAASGIDADRASSPAGASMEMRRVSNTKTLEASGRNLKEVREEIEARAEEATAPKDANGNPIPDISDTEAGPASVAEVALPAAAPAQEKIAEMCKVSWEAGIEAHNDHPYLKSKGVPAIDLHENRAGVLHIPLRNADNELRGLQTIDAEGRKRFVPGMEKSGNFHLLSEPGKNLSQGEILLSEGYATGASLHMATGKPVAVAFDAGNLEPVARALREKFPNAAITICADNDHQHTRRTPEGKVELWNKGVALAQEAAQAVGGRVVAPIFNEEERARGLTDFNDLHQSRGLDEVKMQVGLAPQHDKNHDIARDAGRERSLSL